MLLSSIYSPTHLISKLHFNRLFHLYHLMFFSRHQPLKSEFLRATFISAAAAAAAERGVDDSKANGKSGKKKGGLGLGFTEEEQERIAREVTCDV